MKKEFLKMAGVENEKDFYKLFPTEEAFFGMYPEAKKLVQKKYGGLIKAASGFAVTDTTTDPFLKPMAVDNTYLIKSSFLPKNTGFPIEPKKNEITLVDPRKIRATTNQKINPNVDLKAGTYNLDILDGVLTFAKEKGLSLEDAYNLSAMALAETGFGKTDPNIGHIQGASQDGLYDQQFVNMYINKMKYADKLGIKDRAKRLQVYNGLGIIKPSTEKHLHGYNMSKIYGVTIPSGGIDMSKTPLYGTEIIDLSENVLKKNPSFVNYINKFYGNKKHGGLVKAQDGVEYTGPSIVEYLATKGYKGSKPFRKQLAQEYGVEGYNYSAAKNLELLNKLRENQDLLSVHQQSFKPVSVETIEQMHERNKAALERYKSLPGKEEARGAFDADKFNALLNLQTMAMGYEKDLRSPVASLSFKNAPIYNQYKQAAKQKTKQAAVQNKRPQQEQLEEGQLEEGQEEQKLNEFNKHLDATKSILDFRDPNYHLKFSPLSEGQEEEYNESFEEGLPNKQNEKNNLGFFDYLNLGSNAAALLLSEFLDPAKNVERISSAITDNDGITLIDKAKSAWDKLFPKDYSEEEKAQSSGIQIQSVQPSVTNPSKNNLQIKDDRPSVVIGESIPNLDMMNKYRFKYGDKNVEEMFHAPAYINLNDETLSFGSRNRGDYSPIDNTQGLFLTIMSATDEGDKGGAASIRKYKPDEIDDQQTYIGVDDNGKLQIDYGKNLKNKNLYLTDIRIHDVTGFTKDNSGKYQYFSDTGNKSTSYNARFNKPDGSQVRSLILVNKKKPLEGQENLYGEATGGKIIIMSPDRKYKVYVAGSLRDLDNEIQRFKKLYNLSYVTIGELDNGSFKHGLITKNKKISKKQLTAYDLMNPVTGGSGFYLKQKIDGGSVLPKAQFGLNLYSTFQNAQNAALQNAATWASFRPKGMQKSMQPINSNLINSNLISSNPFSPNFSARNWANNLLFFNSQFNPSNLTTTTTTAAPDPNAKYLFGKFGEWVDKKGKRPVMETAKALNTGFALGNTLAAESQYNDFQRSYEKNLRNQIFTQPVMPSVSGSRGDYVTNTGAFRPNEYTVNKGMYTSNMPGAIVGTQQFAQFGAEIIPPALEAPPVEFAPIVSSSKVEVPIPTTEYDVDLPSAGEYVLPLKNWNVRSGFGKRKAPLKGASTDHNGIDLSAPVNTSVYSPFDGVVSKIYYSDKGGKQLVIKHSDGTKSGYAHLNDYKVSVGDAVSKGQVIALTGNTGNSTGPHLHFTFTGPDGKKLDPAKIFGNYTKPSGRSQSGEKKAPGESIAVTHNNPGNIHYGDFVKQWGATKGSLDKGSEGHVAIFNTIDDGWDAFNKLLFGKSYSNLSLIQARNKWVTGNANTTTPSAALIVKEIGLDGNTKVSDLTPEQQKKYSSLFVKHEDKNMYKKMKDLKLFEEGGEVDYNEGDVYDLTEDQIKQILESGGQLEFI